MHMTSLVSLVALAAAVPAVGQTAPKTTNPAQPNARIGAGSTTPSATPQSSDQPPQSRTGTPTAAPSPTSTATAQTQGSAPANTAATPNPKVGGVAMDAAQPIVVNASAAPNLSILVSAVKAAGLVDTLSGPGPFTVFAPTNDAFGRLAPGTVDTLMKPENKPSLVKVLTYHMVPGVITAEELSERAKAGGGKTTLTTVAGQPLTVEVNGNAIKLTDVSGNSSYVETGNVRQSNGIVHVVNGVLVPKL